MKLALPSSCSDCTLVSAIRAAPGKSVAWEAELHVLCGWQPGQGPFSFSADRMWVLFWTVQENPNLKRPLLQWRWQGTLPWLTEAPSVRESQEMIITLLLRWQNTMRFLSCKQTSIILERLTDPQTDMIWENKYAFVCTAGGDFPLDRKSRLWWMNIVSH